MDEEHLLSRGAVIWRASRAVGDRPPIRTGAEIADELAPRKLLRYLLPDQLGMFRSGSNVETFTTPTPYTPEEANAYLVLPRPVEPRPFALVLEPALIPRIQGPLQVAGGRGIQYILPDGFPAEAIIVPGSPGMRWEIVVK
jgi:hypothetical protein